MRQSGRLGRTLGLGIAAFAVVAAVYIASTDARRRPSPASDASPQAAVPNRIETGPGSGEPVDTIRRSVQIRRKTGGKESRPSSKTATGKADGLPKAPEINAGEYIAALRAAGETEGLAAFSPPGTRPPNPGILVPDDYELPEGFMRHYQSTDDGGQLAAVLTLSPDYELYDEDGNPIALPQDRIVPPELAPPDLPIRILDLPSAPGPAEGQR